MSRWTGRTALVTGASSGIGRAIARRLAAEGMRVAILARREERLADLARELAPADILTVPFDLRDAERIPAVFDRLDGWGGIDVLVNNAGLGRRNPLVSGSTEHWRTMLDVNVLALTVCTREAVSRMRKRGADDGHVLHISSMSAHRVPDGSGMYSATKYAVRALTEALRQELRELGSDIRVTSVSPGFVQTEFAANYHDDPARGAQTYSDYKVLDDTDVADCVWFALNAPAHMAVHDLLVRPTRQSS